MPFVKVWANSARAQIQNGRHQPFFKLSLQPFGPQYCTVYVWFVWLLGSRNLFL